MSLRPEISGFDLARMRSLLGGRDDNARRDLLARIEAAPVDADDEEADALRARCRDILGQAISEGAPFPGLRYEDEAHVSVASLLARYGQRHAYTDSSFARTQGFYDFWEQHRQALTPEVDALVSYFFVGRPLFGQGFDTGWSFYACLSRAETETLLDALRTLQGTTPPLQDPDYLDGFFNDWLRWLAEVSGQGRDLWLYAN